MLFALATGERTIRNLDRCTLLEQLLPEFVACRTLVSSDTIHQFTVFEHTLRAIGFLDSLDESTFLGDLKAEQTERGWVLTLRSDVLFDSGSATLKPGASRAVDKLAQFMNRYPEREIAIEGFTDTVGAQEANRRLSESRAAAVKKALVARGIEPSRIDARGYGPAFPVASNETPTGRQLNRRVEIVINPS